MSIIVWKAFTFHFIYYFDAEKKLFPNIFYSIGFLYLVNLLIRIKDRSKYPINNN